MIKIKFSTTFIYPALLSVMALFYLFTYMHLRAGYELGDHGMYLLHIRQPEQVKATLSHFGLIWNSFFGLNGIVPNRAINISVVLFAVVVSLIFSTRAVSTLKDKNIFFLTVYVAGAAAASAFSRFILDPSYNSLSLTLVLVFITFTVALAKSLDGNSSVKIISFSLIIGFILGSLVITKASTAVAASVYALVLATIFSMRIRSPSLLFKILATGIIGLLAAFLFVQFRTGLLLHIVSSFSGGLSLNSNGGTHSAANLTAGAVERLTLFARSALSYTYWGGWIIVLPVAVMTLSSLDLSGKLYKKLRNVLYFLSLVILIAISVLALLGVFQEAFVRRLLVTVYFIGIGITAVFWWKVSSSVQAASRLTRNIAVAGYMLAPLLTVYGTVNSYTSQLVTTGAGLSLLPAWISAQGGPHKAFLMARQLIITLATVVFCLSFALMNYSPYRLGGELRDALIDAEVAVGERLLLTPAIEKFVSSMRPHAFNGVEAVDAPMVFDLTGQLPISVLLLNGRVPHASWLIDAFGSGFSRSVFGEIDGAEFKKAWVVARLDPEGNLDYEAPHLTSFIERIEEIGCSLEDHFEPVLTTSAPYWGDAKNTFELILLKPHSNFHQNSCRN